MRNNKFIVFRNRNPRENAAPSYDSGELVFILVVTLTTHIDKGHIHNHIIFCAANFVDHHKYVSNRRIYYGIRNMSDKLCREHGLSRAKAARGKAMQSTKRKRRGRVGKAS